MQIVKRFYRYVKWQIYLFNIFCHLDHTQIEAMRRQAKVIEAAKRQKRNRFEYCLNRRPDGLVVLEWRKAVA